MLVNRAGAADIGVAAVIFAWHGSTRIARDSIFNAFDVLKTACTPPKHPPATTAVSLRFFAASGASTTGLGRLTPSAYARLNAPDPAETKIANNAASRLTAREIFRRRIIASTLPFGFACNEKLHSS